MKCILNQVANKPDFGKLLLRVSFGFMFLLHGIHKVTGDIGFISGMLEAKGLPAWISYGVYLGEVVAPIMIILGVLTRMGALIATGTCLFIIYLAHMSDIFTLDKYGAWGIESIGTYLFAFLAIMFLGSGKYAIKPDN